MNEFLPHSNPIMDRLTDKHIKSLLKSIIPDAVEKEGYLYSVCPLCNSEDKESFRWSLKKHICYCFNCKKGGDMAFVISAMEDMTIAEALDQLSLFIHVENALKNRCL